MHEVQSFDDAVRDFRMDGRVVVVTGGAGLLGAEYTAALSAAGAHVVVADVDGEAAERVAAAAPGARAVPVRVDVADADSVSRLLRETLARFGRVDGLVNNAALDPKFDAVRAGEHELGFEAFPLDEWNGALAVNLTGSFLCAQAFAPALVTSAAGHPGRGGSAIVNIGSIYGVVGPDQRLYHAGNGAPPRYKPVVYSVTKSALLGLTRYLAVYYAGKRLRVNALTLGGVDNGHDPDFTRRYAQRTPLGRMACRDEYTSALLFLLSDASSYMTGTSLVVDGGWTAW